MTFTYLLVAVIAFAITAALAEGETEILGAECVNISYPDFYQDLEKLAH